MRYGIRASAIFLLLSLLTACGSGGGSTSVNNSGTGGGGNTGGGGGSTGGSNSGPHVVIVMLENQDYGSVIGNVNMPFFNNLATQNALATNFFANAHPSLANYFMLTTGQLISTDDKYAGTFSGDNVAKELVAAGKTWKIYAESLPSVGYAGDDVYPYIKHHNPFAYFDDVLNSDTQKANMVPFSQFATDLGNNALPSYSLVVPNNEHNGHDCPDGTQNCTLATKLITIDNWLSSNISPVVQNSAFMSNGVLIVTFDESAIDNENGGGKVALVMAGSSIKTGFQSTTMYQFPSVLKFSLERLGVTTIPGDGAGAASMNEFLK
jgi:phosphatidylinositol-3-phosphatase